MRGSHMIKSWSSTQKTVALSSGEAELIAMVKLSSELIGICQLYSDWNESLEGRVYCDSNAALGVVRRKGNGKLRHIRVGRLWIQQALEEGRLEYKRIAGKGDPADLMTKNLPCTVMERHVEFINLEREIGRAKSSLSIE